jgi:hypothetical protein
MNGNESRFAGLGGKKPEKEQGFGGKKRIKKC